MYWHLLPQFVLLPYRSFVVSRDIMVKFIPHSSYINVCNIPITEIYHICIHPCDNPVLITPHIPFKCLSMSSPLQLTYITFCIFRLNCTQHSKSYLLSAATKSDTTSVNITCMVTSWEANWRTYSDIETCKMTSISWKSAYYFLL